MKNIMRLTCLTLFCLGAAWAGFEITLHFGSAVTFFFAAFALAAPSGALFCAPEGYERADGFHVRTPKGQYMVLFGASDSSNGKCGDNGLA